jgi:hypothetical protein
MIPMTFIGISMNMKGICGNELDYPILKNRESFDVNVYWH